jgi:hypothetical protein
MSGLKILPKSQTFEGVSCIQFCRQKIHFILQMFSGRSRQHRLFAIRIIDLCDGSLRSYPVDEKGRLINRERRRKKAATRRAASTARERPSPQSVPDTDALGQAPTEGQLWASLFQSRDCVPMGTFLDVIRSRDELESMAF